MIADPERVHPERIRITGLQEAQLAAMVEIERACAAMYYEIGFDPARIGMRSVADIVALTRNHNVRVAEADHEVAGYMAWRDEAPGVAFIEALLVHPSFQRFGIGTGLIERIREEARGLRLAAMAACAWQKAPWAGAFFRRHGFGPLDDRTPARVLAWQDAGGTGGQPQAGQVILWAPVGEAATDSEDEPAAESGEP